MKSNLQVKTALSTLIAYLYILLFIYAAASKLLDFQNFRVQVAQSPLLTAFAGFFATAVIIVEVIISYLLSTTAFRKIGLYAAFALMVLFTIYIYIIINYSSFVPCSCGGILENMGWKEQLYFNIAFSALALVALYLSKDNTISPFFIPVRIAAILSGCVILMTGLLITSEEIVHHQNNFVRRYPPFPAKRALVHDLKFDSYYFAGATANLIYLGNTSAPSLVAVLDTALVEREAFDLDIKDTLFKFRNVQIRIASPNFILYDGTVPCVFNGKLSNKKAVLKPRNIPGFTTANIIDSTKMLIRTLNNKREHLPMIVDLNNPLSRISNRDFLQKQHDGIFDTEGSMQYDTSSQKFIYTYYYRNQYIIADKNLKVIARGRTIDTTTQARVKTELVKKKKLRKFAAPPFMVNRLTAVHRNLLFINSVLAGKYDTKEMWNNANVIDVYDLTDQSYLMSFYVYKVDGGQINSVIVTDTHLFALIGANIVSYRLNKTLTEKFK